jgi:hypothetical protein
MTKTNAVAFMECGADNATNQAKHCSISKNSGVFCVTSYSFAISVGQILSTVTADKQKWKESIVGHFKLPSRQSLGGGGH